MLKPRFSLATVLTCVTLLSVSIASFNQLKQSREITELRALKHELKDERQLHVRMLQLFHELDGRRQRDESANETSNAILELKKASVPMPIAFACDDRPALDYAPKLIKLKSDSIGIGLDLLVFSENRFIALFDHRGLIDFLPTVDDYEYTQTLQLKDLNDDGIKDVIVEGKFHRGVRTYHTKYLVGKDGFECIDSSVQE